MRAIILAENSHCDLSPLTDRTPHALLPLAGKSILIHALESLHRNAIRDVEVVAPTLHRELEDALDTGPLLGMNIQFAPRMLDLRHLPEHCLIVGLQNLVDVDWDMVFEGSNKLNGYGKFEYHAFFPVKITAQGEPVAMLVPPRFDEKVSCDWADISHTDAIQLPISTERLVNTGSLSDYYEANFRLLQHEHEYLTPAGREFVTGHRAAPNARINPTSILSKHGYFGSNSKVDKSASLSGDVIIGDNVVVDKGARVSDSIIFDNTYIGANTDCDHAIVSGGLMIKVDTGLCLELDDPVLLGAIS